MPRFEQYTLCRNVDVSTIKEMVKRWYPEHRYERPKDGKEHQAMGDILDSIKELQHYRSKVFVS
jgi:oligoribonuclease